MSEWLLSSPKAAIQLGIYIYIYTTALLLSKPSNTMTLDNDFGIILSLLSLESLFWFIFSLCLPPSSWFRISFHLNYYIRFIAPPPIVFSDVWGVLLGFVAHLFNIISHRSRTWNFCFSQACLLIVLGQGISLVLSGHLAPHSWNALPLISGLSNPTHYLKLNSSPISSMKFFPIVSGHGFPFSKLSYS